MEGTVRWPAGIAMPVSGIATTVKYALGHNLGLAKKLSLLQSGDVLVVYAQCSSRCYLNDFRLFEEIDFDCSQVEPP